jgi:hypothetical protein
MKSMKVEYVFLEQYVQVARSIDGGEAEFTEIALPSPDVFVRLIDFNLFWGAALRASAEKNTERAVFVPIRRPNHPPGLVVNAATLPEIDQVKDETITLGKKTYTTRCYKTKGERVIYVDEHDVPVMLRTRGNLADVLTDYAHR